MYSGEIRQSQITISSFYYLLLDKTTQQSKIRPYSNYGGDIMVDVWIPEEAVKRQTPVIIDLGMDHFVCISMKKGHCFVD